MLRFSAAGGAHGPAQLSAVDEQGSFPWPCVRNALFPLARVSRCPVGHGWLSQDRVARLIRAASGRRSSFQKRKQRTTVFLPHQERPSHASKSFSQASRQEKYSLLLRQKAIRCVLVLISKTLIKSLEQCQSAPDEEPVRVELVDTARYSVG